MTVLHRSAPPSLGRRVPSTLSLSWRFVRRSGRHGEGFLHLRIDRLDEGPAAISAWIEAEGSMTPLLARTPVTIEWIDVATSQGVDRHLLVRPEVGREVGWAAAGEEGRNSIIGAASPGPIVSMGDPAELVAVFRGPTLVYLRSLLPAHAGLRGGTYELEACESPPEA